MLTDAIVERGASATAVHVREIALQVFRWTIGRGQKVEDPVELVRPISIAKPGRHALVIDNVTKKDTIIYRAVQSAVRVETALPSSRRK